MQLTKEVMYTAMFNRDSSFEGLFYTAVKTTGIFCRPSCSARKPKMENVEFLKTTKECVAKGYRACKVCRPLETIHQMPSAYQKVIDEFNLNPSIKIKDFDLRQRGIDPVKMRRWFLKNHAITFHTYQRLHRINIAFKKINEGNRIADAAFDTGFESLSGFTESFKTVFGVSPNKSKLHSVINLKRIETPLGTMIACATDDGICLLEFSDRKMLETELKLTSKLFNANIIQGDNSHLTQLESELSEYFAGLRKIFNVGLDVRGTPFQTRIWTSLMNIPYGEVQTYKYLSQSPQKSADARAIARANGMNRISILIPCHRVIGSDGQLKGYGGGLWRKTYLLELEHNNINKKIP